MGLMMMKITNNIFHNIDGSLVKQLTSNKFRCMLETPYRLDLLNDIIHSNRKYSRLVNQQETFEEKGSSETTREASLENFDFTEFRHRLYSHKINVQITDSFLEWFIGFVEGDGSFIVSKNRLFFIINQKDIKTLYFIKEKLGFGQVSWYKTYGRYIVTKNDLIELLILLFKNNLLLKKTNVRFNSWITAYNARKNTKYVNNYFYPKDLTMVDLKLLGRIRDGSWLSGFISAEGCFNARTSDLRARFIIDQKDEWAILNHIKLALGIGRLEFRKDKDNCRFIIESQEGFTVLIAYLEKNNLLHCRKVICYKIWLRYVNHIKDKNNMKIALEKLIRLGQAINKFDLIECYKDEDIVQIDLW